MLVVKIELWPKGFGGDKPAKTWKAVVFNDGSGTEALGNYVAAFFKANRRASLSDVMRILKAGRQPEAIWRMVELQGFQRKRFGPWHLLSSLLKTVFDKENGS